MNLKPVKAQKIDPRIIGIDPGKSGSILSYNPRRNRIDFVYMMPVDENGVADFDHIHEIFTSYETWNIHIILERAVSFGMGTKSAFNYGRSYAALEIAIKLLQLKVTYVEPSRWTKVMHEGIPNEYKPKIKSLMAVKRLYPKLLSELPSHPKTGEPYDGAIDALLLAGYGTRILTLE
ncbi:MAG: hypothetical protein ACHQUC_01250 [Chlamydiales bacterium]